MAPLLSIRVFSDYACPFCFLAKFPLKEAIRGKAVDVVWMPFELRPYPTPTLQPDGEYLKTAWQRSVYPLAARMGVEIRLPEVSPQPYTKLAFEGLEFAKDHGLSDDYNSGVMRAFFQRSQDIGNPAVLADIAADVGLPKAEFEAALRANTYGDRVRELLRYANEEIRVTGVPLFLIGDLRLSGVQPQSTLEAAIEQQLSIGSPPAPLSNL